tara:strand:+ start:7167 stop:9074 length:1908 start_codon:yes stop_codon:yes gene_type:complete
MSKKKILYHSNFSRILSGFGKNSKNILKHLSSTGKYEIVEFANGVSKGHADLKTLPWHAEGGLPSDQESINKINRDPNLGRSASYGALRIDDVIKKEKPDIYLGVEDIWGLSGYTKKPWWNKINCMVWTTLDSLPILPDAIKCAKKIKHYYVWSSFAEKALHEEGHDHVKTLHGAVDESSFYKLDHEDREALREKYNLGDSFVIGFVFRNQLRKSVPNLLEGFKLFKSKNPDSNAKLLLHTNWSEGWEIPRLIKEKNLEPSDILCTYYCKNCNQYQIKPFSSQNLDCPYCGSKKSCNTVNIKDGVNDSQLNEIYNLMDVYCHPFTSGGQEIPLQEAKLCELITLTTNYSCGLESCSKESGGLPLDWSEYREPGTQFIKASTCPISILDGLSNVYRMDLLEKSSMGKKARQYVIDNYSVKVIGSKIEEIIDSMPSISDYNFDFKKERRAPEYNPPDIESNSDWLIDLYKNILKVDLDHTDEGHQYWMKTLENGGNRAGVLDYFRQVAQKENLEIDKKKSIDFNKVIENDGAKKALFVLKESAEDILLSTSLLKSFKDIHPDYDIFFACDEIYHPMILSNPYIYKVLPYDAKMENEFLMVAGSSSKPYFDYYCNLGILTQRNINYHGISNFALDLYE